MLQIWNDIKKLFSNGSAIYFIVIIGLVVYIVHLKETSSNQVIKTDQTGIKQINDRVDTLEKQIRNINPRLDSTNRVVDTVKKKIQYNDNKIKDIKDQAKKQDSVIHTFTPDQLTQYFSNY